MKLDDLFQARYHLEDTVKSKSDYKINDADGLLHAGWKKDLQDEESEDYLPQGYDYSKVLELGLVAAREPGKGQGEALMKKFLSSPIAKKAELIFLDPHPRFGKFADLPEKEAFEKLYRFYHKFGFESRRVGGRMWKVQKGSIPKNELPT